MVALKWMPCNCVVFAIKMGIFKFLFVGDINCTLFSHPYSGAGLLGPNKKISVFRVTNLKILGRIGTHIFLLFFFSGKKIIILCI